MPDQNESMTPDAMKAARIEVLVTSGFDRRTATMIDDTAVHCCEVSVSTLFEAAEKNSTLLGLDDNARFAVYAFMVNMMLTEFEAAKQGLNAMLVPQKSVAELFAELLLDILSKPPGVAAVNGAPDTAKAA